MTESCTFDSARARKTHAFVLQRISRAGQNHIAEELGVSASTVSRLIGETSKPVSDLELACKVLVAAGLKVVPASMQCFPPAKVAIFMELARDHLNYLQRPEQLAIEDDE